MGEVQPEPAGSCAVVPKEEPMLMPQSDRPELTRREFTAGGLLAGLFVLSGCQNAAMNEPLPGPVRPAPEVPVPTPPPPMARQASPTPGAPVRGEVQVLPRSAWTRAGVARPGEINPMGGVSRITIHHDGIDVFTSTDANDAARRMEQVRQAHVSGRRWADIGYHFIIDPAGRVWEGRSIRYQGAHVQDNNPGNLGILCLGHYDRQSPSAATTQSLDRFVAQQMRRYRVPISKVYTHQEIMPTACPGRNMQRYMVATRGSSGTLRLALVESDSTLALA